MNRLNFDLQDDSDVWANCYQEKKLWIAVVIQAFADILVGTNDERLNARLWFFHPVYSVDRKKVLELAGIQEAHAQKLAKKLLEEQE